MIPISDNGISKVWRDGLWVYKQQPAFLTTNEEWCLENLYPYGCVPWGKRIAIELLQIQYLPPETPEISLDEMLAQADQILAALKETGIRHGDATDKNLVISRDKLYLIDFAESRLASDPRADKRTEGDQYWLHRSVRKVYGYS